MREWIKGKMSELWMRRAVHEFTGLIHSSENIVLTLNRKKGQPQHK